MALAMAHSKARSIQGTQSGMWTSAASLTPWWSLQGQQQGAGHQRMPPSIPLLVSHCRLAAPIPYAKAGAVPTAAAAAEALAHTAASGRVHSVNPVPSSSRTHLAAECIAATYMCFAASTAIQPVPLQAGRTCIAAAACTSSSYCQCALQLLGLSLSTIHSHPAMPHIRCTFVCH